MDHPAAYGRAFTLIRKLTAALLAVPLLSGCLEKQSSGVTAADAAPTFTSPTTASVVEGTNTGFYTAAATSPGGAAFTFSVSGGADQGAFNIDGASGALSFSMFPDFESPLDADGDNIYSVDLRVTDTNGRASSQTVTVDVANINEAPVFTSNQIDNVVENTTGLYVATALDPDLDSVTFSISGGDDAAQFNIDPVRGFLRFNVAPDYDAPQDANADNRYVVELLADDGNGLIATMTVQINVSDVSRLRIDVGFPTPNANLGGVASAPVTGNLSDMEDGIVEFDDIAFIDVNGQAAAQPVNDASRWSAQVPFVSPQDQIIASTESADQNLDSVNLSVRNDALILTPDLIAIGSDPDQLLVADSAGFGALVSMNLFSGARTLLANTAAGSGPAILFPEAAVLDISSNRALLIDSIQGALMSIDLATGDRAFISGGGVGAGAAIDSPLSLALDAANNRVLVVDVDILGVVSIDLVTGDRTILSDAATGAGPQFFGPTGVVVDTPANRALVADIFQEAIIAVDLATGDRTIIADGTTGAGLDFPYFMELDVANNRLLIVDLNNESLVSVDLASGAGTTISDIATGAGPLFTVPRALAHDAVRDRVFIVDSVLEEILEVDLATGDRTPFAQSGTGVGPLLAASSEAALHTASNRVLVAQRQTGAGGLVWIDLNSGDRTTLSDTATGSGPAIDGLGGLSLDDQAGQALVVDDLLDAVLTVDLVNGNRAVISDAGTGFGPALANPTAIAFDSATSSVLVTDSALDAVLSVDLASGNRTVISDAGTGGGAVHTSPTAVALDATNNRALVLDADLNALLSVDLTSGNRTVIADQNVGAGSGFTNPSAIALDSANDRVLVADGIVPATLYWVDLGTGDRTAITDTSNLGPVLLNVPSLVYDVANERAFAVDSDIEGLVIVEATSGQRAIVSR